MMSERFIGRAGLLVAGLLAFALLLQIQRGGAARIPVPAGELGAGSAQLVACDDDVSVEYRTFWLFVTLIYEVEVSGISESCIGQEIEVTLVGSDGSSTTTDALPVEGGSVNLTPGTRFRQDRLVRSVILIAP